MVNSTCAMHCLDTYTNYGLLCYAMRLKYHEERIYKLFICNLFTIPQRDVGLAAPIVILYEFTQ